jgi:hypothetical protein
MNSVFVLRSSDLAENFVRQNRGSEDSAYYAFLTAWRRLTAYKYG